MDYCQITYEIRGTPDVGAYFFFYAHRPDGSRVPLSMPVPCPERSCPGGHAMGGRASPSRYVTLPRFEAWGSNRSAVATIKAQLERMGWQQLLDAPDRAHWFALIFSRA